MLKANQLHTGVSSYVFNDDVKWLLLVFELTHASDVTNETPHTSVFTSIKLYSVPVYFRTLSRTNLSWRTNFFGFPFTLKINYSTSLSSSHTLSSKTFIKVIGCVAVLVRVRQAVEKKKTIDNPNSNSTANLQQRSQIFSFLNFQLFSLLVSLCRN